MSGLSELTRLKISLLCQGIRLPESTKERFPGYRQKRASLSEGVCFKLLPESGGEISANLAVHEPFVARSEYSLSEDEGWVCRDGRRVIRAKIIDYPSWYRDKLPDGTTFQEVVQMHYEKILATSLTNFCEFKEEGRGCHFCALGYGADKRRFKDPDQIAGVIRILKERGIPFEEVNLNSGSLLDEKEAVSMFVAALRKIREVTRVPVYAQICPPEDPAFLERLKEAGLTTVSFNIEIFDEQVRREIMPAKGSLPVGHYLDVIARAVALFGRGNVSSWLIAGLEHPQSTIRGIRELASRGAIPFVSVFRPLIGSKLAGADPPKADLIYPVFEALGEELARSCLNPAASPGGCVKCNCCSALQEVFA